MPGQILIDVDHCVGIFALVSGEQNLQMWLCICIVVHSTTIFINVLPTNDFYAQAKPQNYLHNHETVKKIGIYEIKCG